MATYPAIQIANKLLAFAAESVEQEELMSNMKLQKMLYYQQGFHLAAFGTPLFNEQIEAWTYGPVVPDVYRFFKENGAKGIEPVQNISIPVLSEDEETLFHEVCRIYGAYSAVGLMRMTHAEGPWSETVPGAGCVISQESMRRYFATKLQ